MEQKPIQKGALGRVKSSRAEPFPLREGVVTSVSGAHLEQRLPHARTAADAPTTHVEGRLLHKILWCESDCEARNIALVPFPFDAHRLVERR